MDYTKEELESMLETKEMSSQILETLLDARKEGIIDFKLIDIREQYEYSNQSIVGADLLFPTSIIDQYVPKFKEMKDENVILYCRTGNRTGYVMAALRRMGLGNVVHLTDGIVAYRGLTTMGAKIPN